MSIFQILQILQFIQNLRKKILHVSSLETFSFVAKGILYFFPGIRPCDSIPRIFFVKANGEEFSLKNCTVIKSGYESQNGIFVSFVDVCAPQGKEKKNEEGRRETGNEFLFFCVVCFIFS